MRNFCQTLIKKCYFSRGHIRMWNLCRNNMELELQSRFCRSNIQTCDLKHATYIRVLSVCLPVIFSTRYHILLSEKLAWSCLPLPKVYDTESLYRTTMERKVLVVCQWWLDLVNGRKTVPACCPSWRGSIFLVPLPT